MADHIKFEIIASWSNFCAQIPAIRPIDDNANAPKNKKMTTHQIFTGTFTIPIIKSNKNEAKKKKTLL